MRQPLPNLDRHFSLPAVRRVGLDRPLAWLRAGWDDLLANPVPGLAYGLLFSIAGDLILLSSLGQPYLFMTAVSGFFLVAPLLAAGLYELSRQGAAGGHPTFIDSVLGLKGRASSLAYFGVVLALVAMVWERISAISFALLGSANVDVAHFLTQVLSGGEHLAFVAAWVVIGALLALFTFAISVVSVPMMLDRNTDIATAMMTSLRAFAVNVDTLVLWGAIIVALTLVGFASLLIGLVVFMPVLGHATWHAYRELVE